MRILDGLALAGFGALAMVLHCGGGGGGANSRSPVLSISAPAMATAGDQETAMATLIPGASYNWTIQNGSLLSGSDTNNLHFQAVSAGSLLLSCTAMTGGTSYTSTASMAILAPPAISSFKVSPAAISLGERVQLMAEFTNGTGTVQPGGLAMTSGESVWVSPEATTVYTLTVANAAGSLARLSGTVQVAAAGMPAWIYVVGSCFDASGAGVPGYWANGAWIASPPPAGVGTGASTALAVSGSDVYLSQDNSEFYPGYLRDGSWVGLPLWSVGTGHVTALLVSGSDVYAGGMKVVLQVPQRDGYWTYQPGYWADGSWVGLPTPSVVSWQLNGAKINAMAASGGHIYAAGFYSVPMHRYAGYWLDTTFVPLVPDTSKPFGCANTIVVSAGDVYVGGADEDGNPGYWVNGIWVGLPPAPGYTGGVVNSLVVSGGDIHAGGSCADLVNNRRIPGCWVDGTWAELPLPVAYDWANARGLALFGDHVYVAGIYSVGSSNVVGYWQDGVWTELDLPSGVQGIDMGTIIATP